MQPRVSFFGIALALLAGLIASYASSTAEAAPPDPALEPVTYENLYEREAYWPPNVLLTETWKPEGLEGEGQVYGAGTLIRVEPSGNLWVRFPKRFGTLRVPANITNVVAEANRVRQGELRKALPNFVMLAGNKMVVPGTNEYLSPYAYGRVERYLLVAVDPMSERFAEIASGLESIRGEDGVLPVLFPQGSLHNDQVTARCNEVGWKDPFLFSQFVQGFTAAYFGDDLVPPKLILQTPNGRLLAESKWEEGALKGLFAAVQASAGTVASAGTERANGPDAGRPTPRR